MGMYDKGSATAGSPEDASPRHENQTGEVREALHYLTGVPIKAIPDFDSMSFLAWVLPVQNWLGDMGFELDIELEAPKGKSLAFGARSAELTLVPCLDGTTSTKLEIICAYWSTSRFDRGHGPSKTQKEEPSKPNASHDHATDQPRGRRQTRRGHRPG